MRWNRRKMCTELSFLFTVLFESPAVKSMCLPCSIKNRPEASETLSNFVRKTSRLAGCNVINRQRRCLINFQAEENSQVRLEKLENTTNNRGKTKKKDLPCKYNCPLQARLRREQYQMYPVFSPSLCRIFHRKKPVFSGENTAPPEKNPMTNTGQL